MIYIRRCTVGTIVCNILSEININLKSRMRSYDEVRGWQINYSYTVKVTLVRLLINEFSSHSDFRFAQRNFKNALN